MSGTITLKCKHSINLCYLLPIYDIFITDCHECFIYIIVIYLSKKHQPITDTNKIKQTK